MLLQKKSLGAERVSQRSSVVGQASLTSLRPLHKLHGYNRYSGYDWELGRLKSRLRTDGDWPARSGRKVGALWRARDWGLGFGDWGREVGLPDPQSLIPNPV